MTQVLTLRRPDDWHLHLRDGEMMAGVLPSTARDYARALVMPNLVPPVVTGDQAAAYRDRIMRALGDGPFRPFMTLYLTETTDPADVARAAADGLIKAVKLYPAGATTNSDGGVRDFDKVTSVLEAMAEAGVVLSVHGEVTRSEVDIFDREAVFIDEVLEPLMRRIPQLRVTMEHITTADAVDFVGSRTERLAATITLQHLIINRNHILAGGIRPHYYCLPVAKREEHRVALLAAATSGDPRFFFGSDSAPHADPAKLAPCGCAGCFTAPVALPVLAQVFENAGALDRLEAYVAEHGARWYGVPLNEGQVTLTRSDGPVALPGRVETGAGPVTVFDPDMDIHWQIERG